jgi:hypothetical protein
MASAIAVLVAVESAQASTMRARSARPWAVLRRRVQLSSTRWSASFNSIATAWGVAMMCPWAAENSLQGNITKAHANLVFEPLVARDDAGQERAPRQKTRSL